jgi:hypothetical protein
MLTLPVLLTLPVFCSCTTGAFIVAAVVGAAVAITEVLVNRTNNSDEKKDLGIWKTP